MTRTFLLMGAASALTLAACADDAETSEAEERAEEAGEETGEMLERAGEDAREAMDEAGEALSGAAQDAEAAMDEAAEDGVRFEGGPDQIEGGLGQSAPVNAVQDAASVVVGTLSGGVAGLTGDPQTYVRNAYLSNLYQIEAGRLAAERGGSQEVRALGAMIASEHEAQQAALMAAVGEAGLEDPSAQTLTGRRQGLLDNLGAAGEDTFDAAFLQQQTQIHTELAALHAAYARTGDHESLTGYAADSGDAAGAALERLSQSYGAAADGE